MMNEYMAIERFRLPEMIRQIFLDSSKMTIMQTLTHQREP